KLGPIFHLERPSLVSEVTRALSSVGVALITGHSGAGKSVVAADCLRHLGTDALCFTFRAEEFAEAHIDSTLQRAQIGTTAQALRASLSAHGRVVIHVESMERLLEATDRAAFSDLLAMVGKEPGWQLLLTCRGYSSETVRSAF